MPTRHFLVARKGLKGDFIGVKRSALFTFSWAFALFGCGSDEGEEAKKPPASQPAEVAVRPEVEIDPLAPVPTVDRGVAEILRDFGQPENSLALMDANKSVVGEDGKIYGPDRALFTGKLRELHSDGRPALESTYLDGVPHGQQLRWHKNGHLVLEALFEDGVLVGVKTRWWSDGRKRDEEYWSKGRFRGRRLWDEDGRLVREELVNF